MKEKVKMRMVGRWFDLLVYPDGSKEFGQHGEFEWGFNQVQNSCGVLLASLLRGAASYDPINYIALGSGLISWDSTPPTKSYSQTTLETEFYRKAISLSDMIWVDPVTKLPSASPTREIEIGYTLLPGEATGSLREFGLFGGTATAALNSGEMVNWVDHALIEKDSSLEIQRKIRLEFQEA